MRSVDVDETMGRPGFSVLCILRSMQYIDLARAKSEAPINKFIIQIKQ